MHRLGKYTASDRMSDLVCGNYHILLIMSRFGIALGFGDRTVDEVCCQSGVDTATFLAVVNLLYDEGTTTVDCRNVSLEAFLRYLHNSHDYFLQYRLPDIRRKLSEAVACGCDGIAEAIIRFFDDYAAEVHKHMILEKIHADDGILVNLASSEMKRLFDWKRIRREARIITPEFRIREGDRLKTIVVYTKMCRGEMTRHLIRNRIADPEMLKEFEWEGFRFDAALSRGDDWTFTM